MKKLASFIALILVFACVASLASCRDASDDGKDSSSDDTSTYDVIGDDTTTSTPADTTTEAPQDTTTPPPADTTTTPPADDTTTTPPEPVDPSTIDWTTASKTVYVKLDNAWIRTNPDMLETSRLVVLHFGDTLECTATSTDWLKVTYGGETCYIATSCITEDNISGNDFEAVSDTVYVTVDSAWLRRGPSTDTDPLSTAVKGNALTRVAKSSTWSKVTVDGNTYYISNSLISTTKPE
ncbi:MAG: hypothetical protein IJY27_06505 [Clostridia bacterium]|nr:hypothetical protein [Clostridia bacterium]